MSYTNYNFVSSIVIQCTQYFVSIKPLICINITFHIQSVDVFICHLAELL